MAKLHFYDKCNQVNKGQKCRPLGYERVYLPQSGRYFVADTPFHIQGDDVSIL